MKVNLYGDNVYRIRIYGSRSWTTLLPNIWNEFDYNDGDKIEISSTTTLNTLKIYGHVKEIHIENSEINSLAGSFTDTSSLETAIINSSEEITDISDAFNGSGIINLTMQTSGVINAERAFKDTKRLEHLSIEPSSITNAKEMLSGSNIKSIDSIIELENKNIYQIFKDAKNYYPEVGIDLSKVVEDGSTAMRISDEAKSAMEVFVSRGKVLMKNYLIDENNIPTDGQLLEIDVKSDSAENTANPIGDETLLDSDFNSNMNVEIDVKSQCVSATANPIEDETGLPVVIDENMNIEIDIKMKSNNISLAKREDIVIDTNDLSEVIDSNFNFEIDYDITNNDIFTARREDIQIDSDNLDSTYDSNYNFELDLYGMQENIDPFNDGSCVFFVGNDSSIELIRGEDCYFASTDRIVSNSSIGGVILPVSECKSPIQHDSDVLANMGRNIFYHGIYKNSSTYSDRYFFKILKDGGNMRLGTKIYITSSTSFKIRIFIRETDTNTYTYKDTGNIQKPNEFIDFEIKLAIVVDQSDSAKRDLYVNGEHILNFDYNIVDEYIDETRFLYSALISEFKPCTTMVFNRTITPTEAIELTTI